MKYSMLNRIRLNKISFSVLKAFARLRRDEKKESKMAAYAQ